MKFFIVLDILLGSIFGHAAQNEENILCRLALMAPKIASLESSEQTVIEKLSPENLAKTHAAATVIFPNDHASIKRSYIASFKPLQISPPDAAPKKAIRLEKREYFSLQDAETGEVLGITGLYAIQNSGEIWIGWYGMAPAARGRGLGKLLLLWTIQKAKDYGYKTVRLWTTSEPQYATANVIYKSLGFLEQDTGLVDPDHENASFLLYSLSLTEEPTAPFTGTIKEALLGITDAELERMKPLR